MSIYLERIENLIRVVKAIPEGKFDIRNWWKDGCGCAIGWALQDAYFIKLGFNPIIGGNSMQCIAEFFDIGEARAYRLFTRRLNHVTKSDMLAALRILMLEKLAHEIGVDGMIQPADADLELV